MDRAHHRYSAELKQQRVEEIEQGILRSGRRRAMGCKVFTDRPPAAVTSGREACRHESSRLPASLPVRRLLPPVHCEHPRLPSVNRLDGGEVRCGPGAISVASQTGHVRLAVRPAGIPQPLLPQRPRRACEPARSSR